MNPVLKKKGYYVFGTHYSLTEVLHKEMYELSFTASLVNLGKGSVAITLPVGGQTVEVSK